MNESYRLLLNLIPRSIAPAANGRIRAVYRQRSVADHLASDHIKRAYFGVYAQTVLLA